MSYYGPVTDPLQDTPFLCTHNKNAYHLIQAISECVCARASPVAAQLSLCCFLVFTFLINLLLTWYHSQFLFALYPFQQLYSTVFNEKKMKTYSWRLFRNQRVFLLFKYSLKDFDFESRFLYSVFFILSLYSTIISDTHMCSIRRDTWIYFRVSRCYF